jgi:hypothetical protein
MTKKDLIKKLKRKKLWDMAHGFWLNIFFKMYKDKSITEKELLKLLEL